MTRLAFCSVKEVSSFLVTGKTVFDGGSVAGFAGGVAGETLAFGGVRGVVVKGTGRDA